MSLFHILHNDLKAAVPATNPTPALATPQRPQKIIGSIPLKEELKKGYFLGGGPHGEALLKSGAVYAHSIQKGRENYCYLALLKPRY